MRLIIHGVTWGRYVAIRELLDDHPGIRMAYLEGTLEIMSPSPEHEREKTLIARLLEQYAVEKDISLNGYGNATFRREAKERGLEPDECYVLDTPLQEFPDIAIEVVLSSGGIDKLSIYRGLGVREVWFFQKGRFHVHRLGSDGYVEIAKSVYLPDLDLVTLAEFVTYPDQTKAVRAYRDTLR